MTDTKHPSGAPWRNFYGRFKGKGLKKSQEEFLESDLASLSPGKVSWEENPERQPLDLKGMFGGKDVWLEIGFGGGEHMVHQAVLNPDVGIIGCEPYMNGVAMLLGKIRAAGVENIRVHPGDARHMFDVLPEAFSKYGVDYDQRVLPSLGNEVLKAVVAQYDAVRYDEISLCIRNCRVAVPESE